MQENTWRPPQDPSSWTGVRDASEFGNRCPQIFNPDDVPLIDPIWKETIFFHSKAESEDCLFLNVYTPKVAATANLPAMVWLHGGGLIGGSGDTYPTEIPTAFHNVVMVTVNYRLSNLGFMPTLDDDAPGNFGLLDVMKALEWVQGNIRNFGGDPDKVTIFGESGGAWAVSLLVMSPMATGLFHRAISQSGVAGVQSSQKGDLTRTETLARGLNCSTASYDDMMSCLRGKSSQEITKTLDPNLAFMMNVSVVVGGSFLPESPWDMMHKKQVNKVDYLLGTNNDEFGFCMVGVLGPAFMTTDEMTRTEFEDNLLDHLLWISDYLGGSPSTLVNPVIDQYLDTDTADDPVATLGRYLQHLTDSWFTAPTVMMAQAVASHSVRVYQYEFQTHTSYFTTRPARVRADHADDLWYLFGIPLMRDENAAWKYNFSEKERGLSLDMMAYWVNFAANGDPNNFSGAARMRDLAKWPRHTPSGQEYLQLDVTSSADVRLRESRMKFWNEEVPRLMGKKIRTARPDEL
ncbi:carboxylesterase 3-like [Branchiostoma floridae x Branchiostoma japonicum]